MIIASEARELSSKKDERDLERAVESIDRRIREYALIGETNLVVYPTSAPAFSELSNDALRRLKDRLIEYGYTVSVSTRGPECLDYLRIKWEISW